MRILITVATAEESRGIQTINSQKHELEIAVTGVGMVATAYGVSKAFAKGNYDLAINYGLAGSFNRSIPIGEVVYVTEDIFSELGAEDDEHFLSLEAMGLKGEDILQSKSHEKFPVLNSFRKVRGITVNTVHGNEATIKRVVGRLNPEVETMEGAAFYFVCKKENIPAIEIRAVSNYVEKRNKDAWNIPLAMRNGFEALKKIINEI